MYMEDVVTVAVVGNSNFFLDQCQRDDIGYAARMVPNLAETWKIANLVRDRFSTDRKDD